MGNRGECENIQDLNDNEDIGIANTLINTNFENIDNLVCLDDLVSLFENSENHQQIDNHELLNLDLNNFECVFDMVLNNSTSSTSEILTSSEDSTFSVLGVELGLYFDSNNVSVLDQDCNSARNFNTSDTFDDLINCNRLPDVGEIPENLSTPDQNVMQLITMFPHMIEERNRRRRSLLYECNRHTKSEPTNNNDHHCKLYRQRRPDALLNHDYAFKINEERCFSCPVSNCKKKYAKSSHLKSHLRRHSGEKPFACNWQDCTWKFSRSDELARHTRSHSGIKPYKCDVCDKAFARSDHLAKHRKVHCKQHSNCMYN